ncbi:hypothetical protein KKG24_00420 [Patescibacteria group bacterium]|nr:hypothetical protein [Patescibacteria group bacterium]
MFEFFGNIFYLLLLGLILIITYVVVRGVWSKEILSKQPNALVWNNSLIILGIILIIATFFIFSWIAGITMIVLTFIVYLIVGKKAMNKSLEDNFPNLAEIFKKADKKSSFIKRQGSNHAIVEILERYGREAKDLEEIFGKLMAAGVGEETSLKVISEATLLQKYLEFKKNGVSDLGAAVVLREQQTNK